MNPISPQRIGALALRYLYLLRGSWIRIVELAYCCLLYPSRCV